MSTQHYSVRGGDLHSSTHTPAHRRPQQRRKQQGDRRQKRPDLGQSCHAGDRTLLTGLRRALAGGDGRISLTPNPARTSRNSSAFCPPPTIGRLGRARRLRLPRSDASLHPRRRRRRRPPPNTARHLTSKASSISVTGPRRTATARRAIGYEHPAASGKSPSAPLTSIVRFPSDSQLNHPVALLARRALAEHHSTRRLRARPPSRANVSRLSCRPRSLLAVLLTPRSFAAPTYSGRRPDQHQLPQARCASCADTK